jgi:hypothetical protein
MSKSVNRGRHEKECRICKNRDRETIEREWTDWGNTSRIAKEYGLSRDSIYRHARALGLFAVRAANVRKALERIIEHAESVEVSASAVVAAIQAHAKINAEGKWVERVERVDLHALFKRMSTQELEEYAREGKLPDWFPKVKDATQGDGSGAVQ